MAFVKRRIDVTISLGEGQFGDDKGPDVTLSGLRTSAAIVAYNGDAQGQLQLRIWGMTLDMINRLTTIGPIMPQLRKNSILLQVGDEGSALSTAYQGEMIYAYGEFNQAPEVVFNVIGLAAGINAVKPVAPSSYKGAADAATIMAQLCSQMGYAFENNGVNVQLSNSYFPGTALDQVKACARAANIFYTIDRGILAIWPKSGFRIGDPIEISPETGLVGYPAFSSQGIIFTTLYNPALVLGGRVNVRSSLQVASGIWNVYSVAHSLEAEMPNGKWFTQVQCWRPIDVQ
jgi:hypothetical protein